MGLGLEQRKIELIFGGTNAAGASINLTVSGLRITSHTEYTGQYAPASFNARVFGLTLSHINELSSGGITVWPQDVPRCSIIVLAGPSRTSQAMSVVFNGVVINAWFDGQAAPQSPLVIEAMDNVNNALETAEPTTRSGPTDPVQLLQQLAGQMGLGFEGLNLAQMTNIIDPYYSSTPWEQALSIAHDANLAMINDRGVMAIWPRTGSRPIGTSLSPQTGLVGYPALVNNGIMIKSLFDPNIVPGGTVNISGSKIDRANGPWIVSKTVNDLDCFLPNGKWFTTAFAYAVGGGVGPVLPSQ